MGDLLDRIEEIQARAQALEDQLADPEIAASPTDYAKRAKALAALRPVSEAGARYRAIRSQITDARSMLADPDSEVAELAEAELEELERARESLETELRALLVPSDPNDDRNVILEIRAGAGGNEAALFAADLFRMYARYADTRGWKFERLSLSETDAGGIKEAVAQISGDRVYSRLKYESGVHRVQRVPVTESSGRIHTSTATVAVLPEAEEVDLEIDPNDLRVDVYRASGPGGQSVNTTDSAVRITHIPSGVVVQCQDEKSQHKNKARALKILRSRLLEAEQARLHDERASDRRSQVGTGDRSERIRTYNFPQSRVTDHRAGLTVKQLDLILEGDMEKILDGVTAFMTAQQERQASAGSGDE